MRLPMIRTRTRLSRQDVRKKKLGQSMTEYALLLFFVVMAVRMGGKQLQTKLGGILDAAFGKATEAVEQAE